MDISQQPLLKVSVVLFRVSFIWKYERYHFKIVWNYKNMNCAHVIESAFHDSSFTAMAKYTFYDIKIVPNIVFVLWYQNCSLKRLYFMISNQPILCCFFYDIKLFHDILFLYDFMQVDFMVFYDIKLVPDKLFLYDFTQVDFMVFLWCKISP